MKIPTELKHKPVIVCENYDQVDGYKANTEEADAKGLSLGLAQWNDRGKVEVSAKVWRHTGGKWSRQSEELPLHRVLDLAILIASSYKFIREESYKYEDGYNKKNPLIDKIGLQGDAMNLSVCEGNDFLTSDLKLVAEIMGKDGEILGERFSVLSSILKELGY